MHIHKSFFTHISTLIISIILVQMMSCDRSVSMDEIEMKPTFPVSNEFSWIVVKKPYISLKSENNIMAENKCSLRSGEIGKITNSTFTRNKDSVELWYHISGKFGEGWIQETDVIICQNEEFAQKTSEKFK